MKREKLKTKKTGFQTPKLGSFVPMPPIKPAKEENDFADLIHDAEAADVAPVRHAHWTCVNTNENVYMCDGKDGCGNCTILLEGTPKENDMLFCAHCGAMMDEETEN